MFSFLPLTGQWKRLGKAFGRPSLPCLLRKRENSEFPGHKNFFRGGLFFPTFCQFFPSSHWLAEGGDWKKHSGGPPSPALWEKWKNLAFRDIETFSSFKSSMGSWPPQCPMKEIPKGSWPLRFPMKEKNSQIFHSFYFCWQSGKTNKHRNVLLSSHSWAVLEEVDGSNLDKKIVKNHLVWNSILLCTLTHSNGKKNLEKTTTLLSGKNCDNFRVLKSLLKNVFLPPTDWPMKETGKSVWETLPPKPAEKKREFWMFRVKNKGFLLR